MLSPPPVRPFLGRAARCRCPHLPVVGGAGMGTQHRPRGVCPCKPVLRAVGWRENITGGMPRAVVRGILGQTLFLLQLPVLGAGSRGLLRTSCGRGCTVAGTRHCPFGLHAVWWVLRAAVGGLGLPPRGGDLAPLRAASGVRRSPSLSRPPSRGAAARRRRPFSSGVGCAGVRTEHQSLSVRSPEPGLLAVGVAGGPPRGAASRPCERRLGLGAHPPPAARPWGGQRGSFDCLPWVPLWRHE